MTTRKLSRFALAALTLALTACNNNSAVTPPLPSASASAAPVGQPPATATPSQPASPGATPTPGGASQPPASPGATPTATPDAGAPKVVNPVVVSGMVYDEEGATVDGARIVIKSLSAAAPYEASATTRDGSWVVNNVPEGVNVEILATKDGWTTRRRVSAFQAASSERKAMDFGAPAGGVGQGAGYFLSDSPEITATEPATKAVGQDASQLTYKLTLSEPLAETSKKRFEDALRIFPANDAASPDGVANNADLENAADAPTVNVDAAYQYAIKKGTIFLDDSQTAAKVTWSPDGLTATVGFTAPMIAAKSSEAKYQVGLVRGAGSDPMIEDLAGNQLGTDENGSREAYPAAAGDLIRNAFREPDLAVEAGATTGDARWNATHDSVATFKVKRDEAAPTLQGIEVNDIGDDLRIELAFSEPMVAFDGSDDGYAHASVLDLAHYTFAVAERASDLTGLDLDGEPAGSAPVADPAADATFGEADADREREFRLTGADADGDRQDVGDVYVEADPRDAKKIRIVLVGRKGWFDGDLAAIKARVEQVADPAGNLINDNSADKAQVTGTL